MNAYNPVFLLDDDQAAQVFAERSGRLYHMAQREQANTLGRGEFLRRIFWIMTASEH